MLEHFRNLFPPTMIPVFRLRLILPVVLLLMVVPLILLGGQTRGPIRRPLPNPRFVLPILTVVIKTLFGVTLLLGVGMIRHRLRFLMFRDRFGRCLRGLLLLLPVLISLTRLIQS